MEWTALEIAGSYRRSGEKASQIQIIAECNACSKEQIKQILREQGFEIKEKEKKTMARPKKEEPIASPEEERNIVVDALQEKIRSIGTELLELAEKQNELRQQEEELTKQYAVIREFVGNITNARQQLSQNEYDFESGTIAPVQQGE